LFCHVLNSGDLFLNSDGLFWGQPGIGHRRNATLSALGLLRW
jgi:hypothetical protein